MKLWKHLVKGAVKLFRMSSQKRSPIFILGATGTGKTDLSIAIAERYGGEIINSDAMQMYKGLDIVTNKATIAEQGQCKHHMLDMLEPDVLNYTIYDFQRQATDLITDISQRGKLPIVVGGTGYYVDSLLWESLIPHQSNSSRQRFEPDDELSVETLSYMIERSSKSDQSEVILKSDDSGFIDSNNQPKYFTEQYALSTYQSTSKPESPVSKCRRLDAEQQTLTVENPSFDYDKLVNSMEEIDEKLINHIKKLDFEYLRLNIKSVDKLKLYHLLLKVDNETAHSFHPNAVRKTIRALEVFKHTGKRQSDIHTEINSLSGEQDFGAQLKYPDGVVIWLDADPDVLEKRLDGRVEKMIDSGLLEELMNFHKLYHEKLCDGHADYTRGIFQCIGFKEFHRYIMLSKEEKEGNKGKTEFTLGVKSLKFATRRYARYQNKWVRKQLFERRNRIVTPQVWRLDSTEKEKFKENVVNSAFSVLDDVLAGRKPSLLSYTLPDIHPTNNSIVYKHCADCDVLCIRQSEWTAHITSRRHRKRQASLQKQTDDLTVARRHLSQTLNSYYRAEINKTNYQTSTGANDTIDKNNTVEEPYSKPSQILECKRSSS